MIISDELFCDRHPGIRVALDAGDGLEKQSAIFWEERNKWFSDIWDFKGARQDLSDGDSRERSGAFPFELPYRLITVYSVRGDTVLDPFVGTGSTILAAMASGRDRIGVDIDDILFRKRRKTMEKAIGASPFFNEFLAERASAHARFVEQHSRDKGALPHVKGPHAFPSRQPRRESSGWSTSTTSRSATTGLFALSIAADRSRAGTAGVLPDEARVPPPG
jgi:hypothetical protein